MNVKLLFLQSLENSSYHSIAIDNNDAQKKLDFCRGHEILLKSPLKLEAKEEEFEETSNDIGDLIRNFADKI